MYNKKKAYIEESPVLYCTHCQASTKRFKQLAQKYKYFSVKETGWPKLDPLFTKINSKVNSNENFCKEIGLLTRVRRPIYMFGPVALRMLKLFRMIKKGRFLIVGDGKPWFQPAYIDDVVQGFVRCLDNNKAAGEVFIIGGEEYLDPMNGITLIEWADIIEEILPQDTIMINFKRITGKFNYREINIS